MHKVKSKGGIERGRREADVVVECNSSLKLSMFILELKGGRESRLMDKRYMI